MTSLPVSNVSVARSCILAWIALLVGNPLFSKAGELRIYPDEVVASPDYPAQVIILEEQGNGTWKDQTRSETLQWRIEAEQAAQVHSGLVEVLAAASQGGNETTLSVMRDGDMQPVKVPIRIATAQHGSPIFPREIAAVLGKSGCNLGTCHGNLHGKAGFRLSLRGDDPLIDYTSIVRDSAGRRVDRFDATHSLLLRKPLGEVAHQGGVRFDRNSPEARILQRWIEEGCQWNAITGSSVPTSDEPPRPDETVVGLDVYPAQALLSHDCRSQQLVVIARYADGTRRDVTRWSRFEPSVVTGVEISSAGLVRAIQPVDVSISISYLSGRAASRLTFLAHERSQWSEPEPATRLDELVEEQLRKLQLQPSPLADDYVFVRRAYLAVVGRLPTPAEVRAFAASQEPDKDVRLIETLVNDPGYALLWAMRWSDLLRNEQKVMSPRGAKGWHAWMASQIASDRPVGEMVAEMLTTLGSTYDHPAASFHRTHREPETAAESIGQVFLGVRLRCARCHNHPFDRWRQDDYYGLAAYFTTLERRQIDNDPRDKFDKHIISGDEVISLSDKEARIWHPGRAAEVGPKPLHQPAAALSAMEPAESTAGDAAQAKTSPLERLAQWLTVDNRMFARNMANRIWFHYMGVGIVDPPDDFRDSNPPSNPELLEYLTDELIRSNYSVRHVARLILTSRTFRRQAAAEPSASQPLGGARVFTGYPLRRMPAEVLYDAVSDATGVTSVIGFEGKKDEQETEPTTIGQRAVASVKVPTKAGFLTTFGKPGRLLACECERSTEVSLGQSLVLVNGLETRDKLADPANRLTRLSESSVSLEEAVEELYLAALARLPGAEERSRFTQYIQESPDRRGALEDVLWALINSKEFPLIR